MKLITTVLRGLIGGLFIGHGTQKLFGWFGGHGLENTGNAFEGMGFRPGRRHAALAGAAEAGGGALLAAGLFTPLAGTAITGVMSQAIRSVHASNGPWSTEGGWEYNAVLIAGALAFVEAGPGPISLDHAFGIERRGTAWALAAAAAGVAGPLLTQKFLVEEAPASETDVPAETVQEHGEVDSAATQTA